MKLLLQEDDTAPDALEWFEEQFIDIVGTSVEMFKNMAIMYYDGYATRYTLGNYMLSYEDDDLRYKLWSLYND